MSTRRPPQILVTGLPLKDVVRDALASFRGCDLAYLALTSKPEGALRDLIALCLREKLAGSQPRLHVGRESGKRVDLVVVREHDRAPQAFIELKCWHTANVEGLIQALAADVVKCRHVLATYAPGVPAYVLLALTHQSAPAPKRYGCVVKYQNQISRAYKGRTSKGVLKDYLRDLTAVFPDLQRLDVANCVGTDFEVDVEVHWLAMGPISAKLPGATAAAAVKVARARIKKKAAALAARKRGRGAAKSEERVARSSGARRSGVR